MKSKYLMLASIALCALVAPVSASAQQQPAIAARLPNSVRDLLTTVGDAVRPNGMQPPCPVQPPVVNVAPQAFSGATPAVSEPAPSRAEISQARRMRARSVCDREQAPAMREACYACAERGGSYDWIRYGSADLAESAQSAAQDLGVSFGMYRCQARDGISAHRAVTALGARVTRLEQRVSEIGMGGAPATAAPPSPGELLVFNDVMAYVTGAVVHLQALIAEQNAQRELDACIADQRGDPRVTCQSVQQRLSAVRAEMGANGRRFVALDHVRALAGALQRIQQNCNQTVGGTDCDQARAALQRFAEILRPDAPFYRSAEVATVP